MDTQTEDTGKSIIPAKYQGKYREKDWLGKFIDEQATETVMKTVKTKNEEGEVDGEDTVPTNKRVLDLDAFFALCETNHIDTSKMKAQRDRPNAPGRIRMTLGNSLRAAARKRHGLFDAEGEWHNADDDFIGDAPLKENRDGTKIAAAKTEAETADAE